MECMVQLIDDEGLRWRAHDVQVSKRNVIHIAREGQDQVNLGGVQDQKGILRDQGRVHAAGMLTEFCQLRTKKDLF